MNRGAITGKFDGRASDNSFESRSRMVNTGHLACASTYSATLPNSRCFRPVRPCVSITIRSIEDIEQRQTARWPLQTHLHDIMTGPLPDGPFDAIYSVDVMEHIEPEQESVYLGNLKGSLVEQGALIVGMPSLESQSYASPQSKIGHINCKSGPVLKATLEKDFHHVFLFSMNDEVVHTGFSKMAHYLFAVCCGKK